VVANNVVKLYPPNAAFIADNVLEQAIGQYQDVLVLGWDVEGNLDPRATLSLKNRDLLWIIEVFKMKLLRGDYDVD
jgi:hypothetical protein